MRVAAIALTGLLLSACATSPRTELYWNVNDRYVQHHTYRKVAYGPRNVNLPAVEQHRFVPPEQQNPQRNVAVPEPRPSRTPGWYKPDDTAPSSASVRPAEAQPVQVANAAVQFRWPVMGRVISDFGPNGNGGRNDGINISATRGEPVRASAAGTVSYCGNELKGYGNLVLIRHEGGYITAYAHVDNFIVNRNDRVAAGQVIAYAGSTGDVTVPQLHFEIRKGVQPIDPLDVLPKSLVVAAN